MGAVVADRFQFRAVCCDNISVADAHFDCFRRLRVGLLVRAVLVNQIQHTARRIVVHTHKAKRIGIPAPVDAVVDAVKGGDLVVGDGAGLNIFKHIAARAGCLAEILVPVCGRVCLAQVLRLIEKRLPEPCARHVQIAAVMCQTGSLRRKNVFIRPVGRADRRVEGLKHKKDITAAHNRLLDAADFARTVKLVKLLKPHDTDVAERRLDRFDFARVVGAAEVDRLSG